MKVRYFLHHFAWARSTIEDVMLVIENDHKRSFSHISKEELRTDEYGTQANRKVLSFEIDGDTLIIFAE